MTDDVALALARSSPAGLAHVASGGRWIPAPHLLMVAERLCAIARGECKRLMVFMPPRHGKSQLISEYAPAWFLGNWPRKRVMVASYGAALASTWGRKSRDVLEEWGPRVFGLNVASGSKAADRWDIEGREGGMVTAGVGGPLTGKGADLLLIDDPLKDSEEAMSEVIRAKHIDWWRSTARTRLMPGGAVVIVQTRWHWGDLAGWLLQDMADGGDQWEVLSLPAIATGEDALGREQGEPLWPEMFDLPALEQTKRALGPYYWGALYQQSPTPDEGGIFNRADFRYFTVEDDRVLLRQSDGSVREWGTSYCRKMTVVDLAVSEQETSDYTVLGEMWVTPERDLLVRSVVRERIAGPDQADFITNHHRDGPILVETIGYQTALVQALLRRGLPVEPVYPDKDKVTRASAAGVLYRAGKVYHLAGAEWLHDFELELLAFPAAAHDDQVDVVAYAARALPGISLTERRQRSPGKTVLGNVMQKKF